MPCFFNKLFCVILCILGSTKRPPTKVPPVAYALSCYFRAIFVCYACVFLLNMNEREQHASAAIHSASAVFAQRPPKTIRG